MYLTVESLVTHYRSCHTYFGNEWLVKVYMWSLIQSHKPEQINEGDF